MSIGTTLLLRNAEHYLAELLAALHALVGRCRLGKREDLVDDRLHLAGLDEVEHALEVRLRAHRRAEHRKLLPPDAMQRCRRVRTAGRAAHDDPPGVRGSGQALLPRRLAHVLDDDVGPAAARRLLHGGYDIVTVVVHLDVRFDALELLVTPRGDDRPRAEGPRDRVRRGRDTSADA